MAIATSNNTLIISTNSIVEKVTSVDKQSIVVAAQQGASYKVVTADGNQPSSVIAIRDGDTLKLQYADGTEVIIEDYFIVCANDACQVTLPNEVSKGYHLRTEIKGKDIGNGQELVYAHGFVDDLMAMAKGNDVLEEIFASEFGLDLTDYYASLNSKPVQQEGKENDETSAISSTWLLAGAAVAAGIAVSVTGDSTDEALAISFSNTKIDPATGNVTFTFTFNEGVTGFDESDISLGGGDVVAGSFTALSPTVYTIEVTPTAGINEGAITIDIASGAVQSIVGGVDNLVVEQHRLSYDTLVPEALTLSLNEDTGDNISNDNSMNISGLEAGAIWQYSLNAGTTWLTGVGTAFELAVDNTYAAGQIQVRQVDDAGNLSTIASNTSVISTNTAPDFNSAARALATINKLVVYDAQATDNGGGNDASLTYTLSGADSGDFDIDAATGEVSKKAGYTAVIGDNKNIIVTATDVAGNGTDQAVVISFVSELSITIIDDFSPAGTKANATIGNVTVTFIFNKGVTGFDESDISLGGGDVVAGSFTALSPTVYTIEVTPTAGINAGAISIDIASGAVQSIEGIDNRAIKVQSLLSYDTLEPEALTLSLATDTGSSDSDNISNDNSMNISGLEAGATWQYSLNAGTTWLAGVGTAFELTADNTYAAGQIQVRQVDDAGNLSTIASNTSAISTDNTAADFNSAATASVSITESVVYDAQATDNGGDNDAGLTYTLSGADSGDFDIDAATGEVSKKAGYTAVIGDNKNIIVTATDVAGNGTDQAVEVRFLDNPLIDITDDFSAAGTKVNATTGNVTFTFTFNEGVTGFDESDISLGGGDVVAGSFAALSSTVYTIVVTPTAAINAGAITIDIASGAVQSIVGGIDNLAIKFQSLLSYDTRAPEVLTLSLATDTGKSDSDNITEDTTVNISGLEADATWQYSLDAGTTWLAGVGTAFELTVDNTYAAGQIQVRQVDDAGNLSTIASNTSVISTNTAPDFNSAATASVSITESVVYDAQATDNGGDNDAGLTYTLSGADSGDFDIDAATGEVSKKAGYTAVIGDNKNIIVTATDVAGNGTDQAVEVRFLDNPSIDITDDFSGTKVNATTGNVTFTFTFNEGVTGFDESDISLGGGDVVAGSFAALSSTVYTIAVTPTAGINAGAITIDIASGAVQSIVGGVDNLAIEQHRLSYDTLVPEALTLSLNEDTGDNISNDNSMNISGLEADATWQYSLDAGTTWLAGVGTAFELTVDNTYAAGQIQVRQVDDAGNLSTIASNTSVISTNTAPDFNSAATALVSITESVVYDAQATDNGGDNDAGLTYTLSGADSGDFDIDAATGEVSKKAGYTAVVGDSKNIIVTATDVAGNGTDQAVEVSFLDNPLIDITDDFSAAGTKVNATTGNVTFTFTFNEGVTGFDESDISLGGGDVVAGSFAALSSTVYTIAVTPTAAINAGAITIDIASGAVQSIVGGIDNLAIEQHRLSYDTLAPEALTLSLNEDTGDNISNDNSMNISGLEAGATWQYSLDAGTTWLAGVGTAFELTVDNTYAAGQIQVRQVDDAGNLSTIASNTSVISTNTAPDFNSAATASVSITESVVYDAQATDNGGDNDAGLTYTLSGADSGDFDIDAATGEVSKKAGYTAVIGDNKNIIVTATDVAGNGTDQAVEVRFLDNPSIDITDDFSGTKVNATTGNVTFTFTFNEGVTGFDESDISLGGGDVVAGSFAALSSTVYTIVVTPTAGINAGAITIDIASGAVQSIVGGVDNLAIEQHRLSYDTLAPEALTLSLNEDTGDNISNDNSMNISGLEAGATWQYSLDAGTTWLAGVGTAFELTVDNTYAAGQIQVRQVDDAGNLSTIASNTSAISTNTAPDFNSAATASVSITESVVYDAQATDNGGDNDAGLTYTLSGADSGDFDIDAATGEVSKKAGYTAVIGDNKNIIVTATDVAGNGTDQAVEVRFLDNPSIDITDDFSGTKVNATTGNVTFTFTFNEGVTGFDESDISLGGGDVVAGSFAALSSTVYTIEVTPTAGINAGAITIDIASGAVQSIVGGVDNLAIEQHRLSYDTLAPEALTLSLNEDTGDNISNDNSMNISGLEADATWQYSLDAGTTWLAGVGTAFELTVDNTYAAGQIQVRQVDDAGNLSTIASNTSVISTNTAPDFNSAATALVSITESVVYDAQATDNGGDNDAGLTYTLSGADSGDFDIDTATGEVSKKAGYTAVIGDNKNIIVTATDVAGNGTDQAVEVRFLDNPSIDITDDFSGTKVNATTGNVTFTFTFNEGVTGFDESDISLGGGDVVAGSFTALSSTVYTIAVTPTAGINAGAITIDIASGAVQSIVGGVDNLAIEQHRLSYDTLVPEALTLSLNEDTGDNISNDNSMNISGLEADATWQYSLDAGTTWLAGVGTAFELTVDNTYAAGQIQVRQVDDAGNLSTIASNTSVISTNTAPDFNSAATALVSITESVVYDAQATDNGGDNDAGLTYTLSGADSGDFDIDTATGEVSKKAGYTAVIGDNKNIIVTATDVAGNGTDQAVVISFVSELSITITDDFSGTKVNATTGNVTVTFIFNKEVTGFDESDISLGGGDVVAGSFTAVSSTVYTIAVTPTAGINAGAISIDIAAGAVQSIEGIDNRAIKVQSLLSYDTLAPEVLTLSLNEDTGDNISNDNSMNISGLEAGATWQYSLDAGTTWLAGVGTAFELTVDNTYAAGQIQVRQVDSAGNLSTIASNTSVISTNTAPDFNSAATALVSITESVVYDAQATDNGGDNDAGLTYTLSGADSGDFDIDAATGEVSKKAGYTAVIGDSKNIIVTATDVAGNGTDQAVEVRFLDNLSIDITDDFSAAGTKVNATTGNVTFTFTFNEGVTGFDESDISLGGGDVVAGSFAALSSTVYTIAVTPTAGINAGAITIDIASGAVQSIVGGIDNLVIEQHRLFYDTLVPEALTLSLATDTGSSDSDNISNDNSMNISGLEAGATWQYSLNAGTTWLAGVGTAFELTVDNTYAAGQIQVRQVDDAGNLSTIASNTSVISTDNTAADFNSAATALVSITESVVYDAQATDNGGDNDAGLTYTLSGADSGDFDIDAATGEVSKKAGYTAVIGDSKNIIVTATDVAGNGTDQAVEVRFLDNPSIDITDDFSAAGTKVNATTGNVTFTFTFNEGVTGFDESDISLGGGDVVAGSFAALSSTVYTIAVTPTAGINAGAITIDIASGAVQSIVGGIDNLAIEQHRLSYDTLVPEALTLSLATDTGSSDSDNITEDTTVNISGLEADTTWQYSLNAGTTWLAGVGTAFELTNDNTYAAGQIQVRQVDDAGNLSTIASNTSVISTDNTAADFNSAATASASITESVVYDAQATDNGGDNDAGLTYTLSGVDSGDFDIDAATGEVSKKAGYTAVVGDSKNIIVTATDVAGNGTDQAVEVRFLDNPLIDITDDFSGTKVNATTGNVTFTFTFNKGVTGFDESDISLGGGDVVAGSFTALSSTVYTIEVTPTAGINAGAITIDIASGAVQSIVGGIDNLAIEQHRLSYDTLVPEALTLSLNEDTGDNISNVNSMNISGLEAGAIWQYSLNAGTTWLAGVGTAFELTVDNTYAAGQIQVRQVDDAGNLSTIASNTSVISTNTAPDFNSAATVLVSITESVVYDAQATDNGGDNDAGLTYTLSGVDSGDFDIDAATGEVSKKAGYTGVMGDSKNIIVTATDVAGNGTDQAVVISFLRELLIDITDQFSRSGSAVNATTGNVTFTFTFSEGVTGFDESDISVSGGDVVVGSFARFFPNVYIIMVTPTAGINEGAISIDIASGAVQSSEGIDNRAAEHRLSYDTLAPEALTWSLATDTGKSDSDNITEDPTVNISGLEDGATWEYRIFSSNWQAGVGTSFELGTYISYGAGLIDIRQTDASGNVTTTVLDEDIVINNTGPTVINVRGDQDIIVSGIDNSVDGVYRLVDDTSNLSFSGGFNPFNETVLPSLQEPSVIDISKPVYEYTNGVGEVWYLWAMEGSGYHISQTDDTSQWYWESIDESGWFANDPVDTLVWMHSSAAASLFNNNAVLVENTDVTNAIANGQVTYTLTFSHALDQSTFTSDDINISRSAGSATNRVDIEDWDVSVSKVDGDDVTWQVTVTPRSSLDADVSVGINLDSMTDISGSTFMGPYVITRSQRFDTNPVVSELTLREDADNITVATDESEFVGSSVDDVFTYAGESTVEAIDGQEGYDIVYVSSATDLDTMDVALISIEFINMLNDDVNQLTINNNEVSNNAAILTTLMDTGDSVLYNSNTIAYSLEQEMLTLGTTGDDIINMTVFNELAYGNGGNDTFVYQAQSDAAANSSNDVIADFAIGGNSDVLDISRLLDGENSNNIEDFITFSNDSTDTTLTIDINGDSSGTDLVITLNNTGLTTLDELLVNGNVIIG